LALGGLEPRLGDLPGQRVLEDVPSLRGGAREQELVADQRVRVPAPACRACRQRPVPGGPLNKSIIAHVTELGYMGIGVRDLDAWKHGSTVPNARRDLGA
jgi:hypothetical protein